ncbi:shikimate kinase [Flavilitoribacter nigricans]|nr:shikimate kinase [Flavilitoribacter nigricans]
MRIYLIGFMGSGKTHTGKALARQLGYIFTDLDDLIEKEAGMDIPAIFRKMGEEEFRRIEQKVLHDTSTIERVVISTGGGVPCFFDNIDWMNAHGLTVFLDTPPEILAQRLMPERAHRPLLQAYNEDTLLGFIRAKLSERMYFYRQAEIIYQQQELAGDVASDLLKVIDGKRKT